MSNNVLWVFRTVYSLGVPNHDKTSLGGGPDSTGYLKLLLFQICLGKRLLTCSAATQCQEV